MIKVYRMKCFSINKIRITIVSSKEVNARYIKITNFSILNSRSVKRFRPFLWHTASQEWREELWQTTAPTSKTRVLWGKAWHSPPLYPDSTTRSQTAEICRPCELRGSPVNPSWKRSCNKIQKTKAKSQC